MIRSAWSQSRGTDVATVTWAIRRRGSNIVIAMQNVSANAGADMKHADRPATHIKCAGNTAVMTVFFDAKSSAPWLNGVLTYTSTHTCASICGKSLMKHNAVLLFAQHDLNHDNEIPKLGMSRLVSGPMQ